MNIPAGNLSLEYEALKGGIDSAIFRVLNSGWFILGAEVQEFERAFADYCGAKFCIGVASGTEAIALALTALNIGSNDIVITVPNTAVPTVSAISMTGAEPAFVDVDRRTMLMEPKMLRESLKNMKTDMRRRVKAIIPVHLYGLSCSMDDILGVAEEFNLKVVEDCAQAHGAEFDGRKVGTFGSAGCFSFYPSKNLGCYGDGGAIVTNDEEIYRMLLKIRNYGQEERYYHTTKGINSRLDELQAAILRVKLNYLDSWNEKRKEIAEMYKKGLSSCRIDFQETAESRCSHVYHQMVIRCKERDALQKYLSDNGIQTLIHYPIPVHFQKAYNYLGYRQGSFPVAEESSKRILSLPIYPQLAMEEVGVIVQKAIEVLQ